MNRNVIASLTAASLVLISCGRPSSSKSFSFDGVGDPQPPKGNNVPGEYGGTIEMTRWNLYYGPHAAGLLGVPLPDFSLAQAYFNKTEIEGLGGFGLLLINVPAPPRIPIGATSACVLDNGLYPLLGGSLESVDVGERVLFDPGDGGHRIDRDSDEDLDDPASDLIVYFTGNVQSNIEYGTDYGVRWDGGTLAPKGFVSWPERQNDDAVLAFPEDITSPDGLSGPLVNGDPMNVATNGTLIPADESYSIRWRDTNQTDNLLGTQIVVVAYGPYNLGASGSEYDAAGDTPYFNKFAVLNCLVADVAEEFVLFEQAVDPTETAEYSPFSLQDVIDLGKETGKYASSTEDFNGNGVLDSRPCGGVPPRDCVEDGNGNGQIDKMYGLALIVNRRTESVFQACARGTEDDCSKTSDIFVSGNAYKAAKFEFGSPTP